MGAIYLRGAALQMCILVSFSSGQLVMVCLYLKSIKTQKLLSGLAKADLIWYQSALSVQLLKF